MGVPQKTAVVAFVPVIHKGYVDFFDKHQGDIYILGDDLVKQFTFLTRDLRLLGEKRTVQALKTLFPDRKIGSLSDSVLSTWNYETTTMPEDEISHEIAEKYKLGSKVIYVPVFLRWNRLITLKELEVDPNRRISREDLDREFMNEAIVEAPKSEDWWRQVAAVAVKNGRIIQKAHNKHLPTSFHLSTNGDPRSNFNAGEQPDIYTAIHAEGGLIAEAAREGISLNEASLYVTTFPCPNCARLIGTAGIKKVYYSKGYSLLDAEKILEHFGVEIILVQ